MLAAWTLHIIGPHRIEEGGDGDEYLAELRRLASQGGVSCQFVGPIFDQQALAVAYRRAAIFVYPSLAETGEALGLAPLEAMAAGCAVVVSSLQCFADYIEDDVTGLTFDHRSHNAAGDLATQLARLIAGPQLLSRIATSGRRVAADFGIAPVAGRMLDDFRSLLAVPKSP